ncbi:MAG: hypothetical protein SFW66_02645 [Gammaproteobacteria bacterium]|nr:hypothetical protein [Gammaproteobacteria bacterium]
MFFRQSTFAEQMRRLLAAAAQEVHQSEGKLSISDELSAKKIWHVFYSEEESINEIQIENIESLQKLEAFLTYYPEQKYLLPRTVQEQLTVYEAKHDDDGIDDVIESLDGLLQQKHNKEDSVLKELDQIKDEGAVERKRKLISECLSSLAYEEDTRDPSRFLLNLYSSSEALQYLVYLYPSLLPEERAIVHVSIRKRLLSDPSDHKRELGIKLSGRILQDLPADEKELFLDRLLHLSMFDKFSYHDKGFCEIFACLSPDQQKQMILTNIRQVRDIDKKDPIHNLLKLKICLNQLIAQDHSLQTLTEVFSTLSSILWVSLGSEVCSLALTDLIVTVGTHPNCDEPHKNYFLGLWLSAEYRSQNELYQEAIENALAKLVHQRRLDFQQYDALREASQLPDNLVCTTLGLLK